MARQITLNLPAGICLTLTAICLTGALMLRFSQVDIYSRDAVAKALIACAALTVLCGIFAALSAWFYLREHSSRGRRALRAGCTLLLSETLLVLSYSSPLPQLSGRRGQPCTPVRDVQLAFEVLRDDSQPVTLTGLFSEKVYRLRLDRGHSMTLRHYALCAENGAEIISPPMQMGIYTVTYSPATGLPVSIVPYDPDCGENTIVWLHLSDQVSDGWIEGIPDFAYVTCTSLDRPFPRMLLRISNGSETVAEKEFTGDAKPIQLMLTDTSPGSYSAQLFAVYQNVMTGGQYRIFPVSNAVTVENPDFQK